MRFDPNQIPGYLDAVAREQSERERCFIYSLLPITETLCGIEVLPFSPFHFLVLQFSKSPFVVGGLPMETDIAKFFWCLSPRYVAPLTVLGRIDRWRSARRCRRLKYRDTIESIHSFIDDAFADAHGGPRISGEAICGASAAIVNSLASAYGWSIATILQLPYKQIWQFKNIIRKSNDPDAQVFNKSRRIVLDWIKAKRSEVELNRKN